MPLSKNRRETLTALGFLGPNFIGFLLFVAFPVIYSFVMVFTNYSLKPAVITRFVGLDNIWRLVGFRPIEGANPAGGVAWIAALVGAWAFALGGAIGSLMALARRWPGTRLGGMILLALSLVLLVASAVLGAGVAAALVGLTIAFGAFFLLTDRDSEPIGKGAVGPVALTVATIAIYQLHGPVFRRWEPLDPNFWYYFYNTLYLMVAIPISIAGSLLLALVLSEPLLKSRVTHRTAAVGGLLIISLAGLVVLWARGHADFGILWAFFWFIAALGIGGGVVAFRTLFYIPTFTAGIAVMLLWKQLLNPSFGPINEGLRIVFEGLGIHREPPKWLTDPAWAKLAIMMMNFWIVVGGSNMLLYLAGLSNIPRELYEAADIDGAGRIGKFWNVTWPQLAPTTFFIVIMTTIGGLQGGFEQARVLTQGGPAGSTKTLAYYVYEKAFEELELGYASAIAWVLFLMVFVLTALNWRFGNRYVNE